MTRVRPRPYVPPVSEARQRCSLIGRKSSAGRVVANGGLMEYLTRKRVLDILCTVRNLTQVAPRSAERLGRSRFPRGDLRGQIRWQEIERSPSGLDTGADSWLEWVTFGVKFVFQLIPYEKSRFDGTCYEMPANCCDCCFTCGLGGCG